MKPRRCPLHQRVLFFWFKSVYKQTSIWDYHLTYTNMSFSSLRFDHFCDFGPKVCFSASGSKRFKILSYSSNSLTPSIFSVK
ncbi:hypothetical protein Hanom_Chr06g00497361 [Helianthus anomalus]